MQKGESSELVKQARNRFVWKVGGNGKAELAMKIAPPKMKWSKGRWRNIIITVSEKHDPGIFQKVHKAWQESEEAFKKAKKTQDRKEKGKLWKIVKFYQGRREGAGYCQIAAGAGLSAPNRRRGAGQQCPGV